MVHGVAVDPGGAHCGVCQYTIVGHEMTIGECETIDTEKFEPWFEERLNADAWSVVVTEQFRLYPWMADSQRWSSFRTVEIIGSIRWMVRKTGGTVVLIEQPASIKKTTQKRCDARGVNKPDGTDRHAHDAWLHAWYYRDSINNRRV